MRFEGLDLNLLVVLDALLQERNVSAAAERLHMSQSGASGALGRLREFFGDELLVTSGRSLVPTPRAEELLVPVRESLDRIRDTILTPRTFDPLQSDRSVAVMAIDTVAELFLARALEQFAVEAPAMSFEILPLIEDPVGALQRGRCDIVIALDYVLSPDHPSEWLYDEEFVVIGWTGNSAMREPMTKQLYQQLGHVSVRVSREVPGFDESAIRRLGIVRQIEVIAPSFVSTGRFVVGTNRIATVHRRLARHLTETLPLTTVELPFDFPAVREVMQWLSRNNNDRAIMWVVRRLKEIAATSGF